jgi:hypothetical protein
MTVFSDSKILPIGSDECVNADERHAYPVRSFVKFVRQFAKRLVERERLEQRATFAGVARKQLRLVDHRKISLQEGVDGPVLPRPGPRPSAA